MNTSLTWLYELEDRFFEKTGRTLWSMSDWHNEKGDFALPKRLLSSLNIEPEAALKYRFLDTSYWLKERISEFYSGILNFKLPSNGIAFCHNSTSSIYLVIQTLSQIGVKRALVITPCYFSILSALNQGGISSFYHHLDLLSGLEVDVEKIIEEAKNQMVQYIFIDGPIFSTGKIFPDDALSELITYTEGNDIFLVVDETLAGLPWKQIDHSPYISTSMRKIASSNKGIYIFSITKSLFINGIKHSIVVGSEDIVFRIERTADHIMGGLTINQMELAVRIYSSDFWREVCQTTKANAGQFCKTFDLCKTIISDTNLKLTPAESGFHCIVYSPTHWVDPEKKAKKIVEELMFEHCYSAIPLQHFGFPTFSPVGFRINLSKSPGKLNSALGFISEIIYKYSDFFN